MYFLLLWFVFCTAENPHTFPVIITTLGPIRGEQMSIPESKESYYAFQGIPYAEPPVGRLRFQPPEPAERWVKIREATKDPPFCVQEDKGQEDCLYLNVYTPRLPSNSSHVKKAVMVYLHGGSFSFGSAEMSKQKPDNFMTLYADVVLVIPQYRLNVFGFLSTKDKFAEGNAGLKDQIAALKWVHDNIANFGGNPKKVTIFGQSAGGVSVMLLMISPLTKGLFYAGISESGSILNHWTLQNDPVSNAFNIGAQLNITTNSTKDLIAELQQIPADQLSKALDMISDIMNPFPFVPSKERKHPDAIIVEDRYRELKGGYYMTDIPFLCGYNENEAKMIWQLSYLKWLLPKYGYLLIPKSLNIDFESSVKDDVLDEIIDFYFPNKKFSTKNIYRFASDELFVRGIRKQAELMRNHSTVYMYKFAFNDEGHTAELPYLFSNKNNTHDKLTSLRMIQLWTNFAKYRNPTPSKVSLFHNVIWGKLSKNSKSKTPFLVITDDIEVVDNVDQESFEFWEKIFAKYGKTPFYTW